MLCLAFNSYSQEQEDSSYDSTAKEVYEFQEKGANSKDIVPENWEILSEAIGDLNGDGFDDLAFFSRRSIKSDSENHYTPNPIVFAIYWGKEGGFTQYKLYEDLVSPEDGQIYYEDLSVNIPVKRVLTINVKVFLGYGSWTNPNFSVKYRYQNGAFYKIGYDADEFHRATGDAHDVSINYLTGKKRTILYNVFEDSIPKRTEWETINEPLTELGSEPIY